MHLLPSEAENEDEVQICGYTWDEPRIQRAIVEACRSGARVDVVLNRKEVRGQPSTTLAVARLVEMMTTAENHGAEERRYDGRLRAFIDHGVQLSPTYREVNRVVGTDLTGASHLELFYFHPALIDGSVNWIMSNIGSVEMSVACHVERTSREAVESFMRGTRVRQKLAPLNATQGIHRGRLDESRIRRDPTPSP